MAWRTRENGDASLRHHCPELLPDFFEGISANALVVEQSVPKSIDEEGARNCCGLDDRWAQTSGEVNSQ
jgi:hypothetical protein